MQRPTLSESQQRVLGCLIEKRFTTPDQYPLSLNALRLACNQSTNRNPIANYEESEVRAAAQRLCELGLARLASTHTSRAIKYRHLAEEALELSREQLALIAVLLLRGAQTPGELKARSERIASFASLGELEAVLEQLCSRGFVRRLARRPGQKEERFEHALAETPERVLHDAQAQTTAALGTVQGHASPAPGSFAPVAPATGALVSAPAAPPAVTPHPRADDGDEPSLALRALADRLAALEARVSRLERADDEH